MMRFLRGLLLVVVILGAAYLVMSLLAEPHAARAYDRLLPVDGVAVLAHAGGALLWPDNTMTAFSGAAELGADVLELDIHESASGEFVVIHDATVDRTTDGQGAIAELTLPELRRLDAGYRWTPAGPRSEGEEQSFAYRASGVTLPTLSEVLGAFPAMAVNVELKQDDDGAARRLCETLRGADAADRVMVGSFHGGPLAAFRDACPDVSTSASQNEVIVFLALEKLRLSAVLTPPYDALQVPVSRSGIRIVTPHFVRAAHARGVDVHVWTVNDEATMRELVAMGVDGLITDRPDRAMRMLGREFAADIVPDFVEP
ncbi:MAG TPA: glycerophosphodiester phosphodiesterase [Trueperaceae bacterium]|nr:glycerophosphodiester phosphodiesterase [Trueperaceae bacterium]